MTTEIDGIQGIYYNHNKEREEKVIEYETVRTGKMRFITYGNQQYAMVEDFTGLQDGGTLITLDYATRNQKQIFVPKGTNSLASELGLPEELGTITVE